MQFWAIFSDTFRSLKARGLFWVILSISVTLAVVFASIGTHEQGWSIFFGALKFDSEMIRPGTVWERSLLLNALHNMLDYWCMTYAPVLALFAAATIFPDTMQPGTIDLLLSKPVSRGKLFLGKYCAALWFVALQTLILVSIGFLSLWWRLHTPYWGMFWCVGLVALIFSFVFCFTTLIGVMTRSSMAALLWSILFWFLLWAVQKTEQGTAPKELAVLKQLPMGESQYFGEKASEMHQITRGMMHFLPRTQQTGELFTQMVQADAPYSLLEMIFASGRMHSRVESASVARYEVWGTIASGVGFQAVMLFLAFWHFRTRDF